MQLSVVTGRAGSGKSRFLLGKIKELLKNPFEKIIVIVPGQLTFETEKRIMHECEVQGFLGLEVLSVSRLALKIIERTGSQSFLSNAQKANACHLAVSAFEKSFGGAGRLPDFEVSLAALLTWLKSYCQTPRDIKAAADKAENTAFGKKLLDISNVYEKYIQICADKADIADMYALAARETKKADFLRGAYVFIDGADSFSPAVISLLQQVIALSKHTYAAFQTEGRGVDSDLFEPSKKDMQNLILAAKEAGIETNITDRLEQFDISPRFVSRDIKFLEENIYSYPYCPYDEEPESVRIVEAKDIEQEIKELADNIIEEVKRGKRYKDIAVVAGEVDKYLSSLKTVFAQCKIPFFIDQRRALSENTFFNFLYSAVCAAAGDYAYFEGYVYSEYSPLTPKQRADLKSYAMRYALKGWHYNKIFIYGNDAKELELIRLIAIKPISVLAKALNCENGRAQTNAVRQFVDSLNVCEKLKELSESITEPFGYAEKLYTEQIYEKSVEVLEGIADITERTPVTCKMLCSLIKTGFEAVKIAVIPPTTDEVTIFDLSVARLPGIDVLFAIGVHDGVWPSRDGDNTGIIPATELEIFRKYGVNIGSYDSAEQKLKIYNVLAKPKERIVLSYNLQTGEPSVIIDRLKRLFPKLKVEKPKMPLAYVADIKSELLFGLSEALRKKQVDTRLLQSCAYHLSIPNWREYAQKLLLRTNAATDLDQNTASALYGGIRCSATRIEKFNECPFKHFIDYGLKIEHIRDYVYDRVDIGAFMHCALDVFTKKLFADNADIKELPEDDVTDRMKKAVCEAAQQYENGKIANDGRFELLSVQLEKELVNTALRIRNQLTGSNAKIFASELIFENEIVDETGNIIITGKIDRVDKAGEYFRIVDYKSSKTRPDLNAVAAGTAIQLIVYLDAAKRCYADLNPVGAYYMKIGGQFYESEEQGQKESRMLGISLSDVKVITDFSAITPKGGYLAIDQAVTLKGELNGRGAARQFTAQEIDALCLFVRKLIKDSAKRIFSGDVSISPTENACAYCGYNSICRVNESYDGNTIREKVYFDRTLLEKEFKNDNA